MYVRGNVNTVLQKIVSTKILLQDLKEILSVSENWGLTLSDLLPDGWGSPYE